MALTQPDIAVTILGSGTCAPSLTRSTCSVLMETGGAKLLFDCGAGTMRRLLEAGITVFDVGYVFFSHLHPDHSGELASFLFSNKYPDPDRRKEPLTLVGATGFADFHRRLEAVYGQWIDLGQGRVNLVELDGRGPDSGRFLGFSVRSLPVEHTDQSIAYRVTGPNGACVVYSGDTDMCDNLVEIAGDADLFICECATPDDLKVDGHLTPSLAGEIARRAGVRKLVLTHFYPECDAADIVGQCRKSYDGPLDLARDLMRFEVG